MVIPCYSLFPCGKNGDPQEVKNSYIIRDALKKSRTSILDQFLSSQEFLSQDFISAMKGATLVPAPRSSIMKENFDWPAREICVKLQQFGFGVETIPLLSRTQNVEKAAFQIPSLRPNVAKHRSTLAVSDHQELTKIKKIVIVDDVITAGSMLTACYLNLKEKFPDASIVVFAAVRTSYDHINKVFQPKRSSISFYEKSGKTHVDHGLTMLF